MPSPFPGMDPYLEEPVEWPSFHNPFISDIAYALNARLPDDYAARVDVRCYVVHPKRDYLPDVTVRRKRPARRLPQPSGGVAVLQRPIDPPLVLRTEPLEMREARVNILSLKAEQRIVTAIELLSPTNKMPGSEGWRRYVRKQREMVRNGINLLEIDLLRAGTHVVLVDRDLLNTERHWDYVASLHRGGAAEEVEAWAWSIRERMPVVAIPLEPDDADVPLDLQALMDHHYDAAAYRRTIDYDCDPVPLLAREDADWANRLLREHGFRENATT